MLTNFIAAYSCKLCGELQTQDTRPLATKDAVADWASGQAEIIAKSVSKGKIQAHSAEVVLECGGEIGDLMIVKVGPEWLTAKQFEKFLCNSAEIAIHVDEIEYDKDEDLDTSPRTFEDEVLISEDVVQILQYDGSILDVGNRSWPSFISGLSQSQRSNNMFVYVRNLIRQMWGENVEKYDEERVVGEAGEFQVRRELSVFRRVEDGDE